MKRFPSCKSVLVAGAALLCLTSASAFAQMPGAGSPAGVNAVLTKLFGDISAFSARADVRVLDKAQQETTSVAMNFAYLDQKVRVEIDLAQMKLKNMPTGVMDSMKQMGMDRIVSVIRPDKKALLIIYPGIQSFVKVALPKEEADLLEKNPKLETTALGRETIDNRPCVKNKVVITDEQGRKIEATVWNAADLKNFPVQVQTTEKENTVIMHYRDIQFAKPDAKQFDAPAGFAEYGDVQQLMQGVMKKMIGGAGKQ